MSLERAAILMVLMRELEEIGRAEVAVLRQLRPGRLRELRAEQAALGEALEIEFGRLRRSPEIVGALDPAAREALEAAVRRYRSATAENARRLLAARRLVDDVARELDAGGLAAAAADAGSADAGPRGAASPTRETAEVLAFAPRRRSVPGRALPLHGLGRAGMVREVAGAG
jgi:hypothetical protein